MSLLHPEASHTPFGTMADENKSLLGLLNGICRREYYGEKDMTDAYLKENLFPDMSENEFEALTHKAVNMIKVSSDKGMGVIY